MGWFRQLITFGGASLVDKAQAEHEKAANELRAVEAAHEAERSKTNQSLERLIEKKVAALAVLARLKKVHSNLGARQRDVSSEQTVVGSPAVMTARIAQTLSNGEIALNSTRGIATGISTAAGSWALVGAVGTASTGTAIGTLTGAAATNATLAWFGGGALAAGGGGMAAGAAVLGGLVAIPAILLTGFLGRASCKRAAARLEDECARMIQATAVLRASMVRMRAIQSRAAELSPILQASSGALAHQIARTVQSLYPHGFFSRAYRWLRSKFWGNYFTSTEEERWIKPLLQSGFALSQMIDQRVMDEAGNPA